MPSLLAGTYSHFGVPLSWHLFWRQAGAKMKRSLNSTERKRGGVKWDEDNLHENEKIKAELNPMKITEPKTPFLSPLDTDDELDLEGAGMSPLSLEDEGPSSRHGHGSRSDSERNTGSSPPSKGSGGGSPSWERRSPRFNDYYKEDDSDTADACSDAEQQEKRRKFMELRRKHYNMREALKKVRELPGEEGDVGAEADVEDYVPQAANGHHRGVERMEEADPAGDSSS